eukprot:sb/3465896/
MICMIVGTPANLLSFYIFYQRPSSAPYFVHTVIAAVDTWICFNGYPIGINLLTGNRTNYFFSSKTFRTLWGVTYEPFVYTSVFLVLVLSTIRLIKLATRRKIVRFRWTVAIVVGYCFFVIIRSLVGITFYGEYIIDHPSSPYPFFMVDDFTSLYADIEYYSAVTLLSVPIIPIVGSALAVAFLLLQNRSNKTRGSNMRYEATITVLIFTTVYIACNIPVVINSIRFDIWKNSGYKPDMGIFKNAPVFRQYYVWTITYIMLVQLNSLLNPIIYYTRMTWFKKDVLTLISRFIPQLNLGVSPGGGGATRTNFWGAGGESETGTTPTRNAGGGKSAFALNKALSERAISPSKGSSSVVVENKSANAAL